MGKMKICVIGAGVMGLSSAVQILEKFKGNVQVTIIAENQSPNTTSDISAGLWGPYEIGSTDSEKINRWSKIMHDFSLDLWRNKLDKDVAICMLHNLRVTTDKNGIEIPSWKDVVFGLTVLNEEQLKRLSEEHGRKYTGGYSYVTFTTEPLKLLPYLTRRFRENGGQIQLKKVGSFEELSDYDVIVNCTGLGSLELVNDKNMHPIRGQVVRVKAPWLFNMFLDESNDGNYIIPNSETVVLGGTHQKGDFNLKVCPEDKEFILKGCSNVVPGLENVQYLYDFVGLRPGRTEVRLETQKFVSKDNKTIPVVHCVGHGGCGVTLSWGCATDVLENVTEVLKNMNVKGKL